MNLQQLRYLVATADEGTMKAAATTLYVAQPVVSRSLRALERELGVVLLERVGRRVVLTATGEAIVERARRVLRELSGLQEEATRRRRRQPPLVLATTPTLEGVFARRLAPALLGEPPVPARVLRTPSRDEVAAAVRDGRAELGFTDLPVGAELETIPLGDYEVVLVSPPGTDLPPRLTLQALDGLSLILPTAGSGRRAEYETFFHRAGVTPVVALETDERSSWTTAVLSGLGSFLWYRATAEGVAAEGAELRPFEPPIRQSIGMVHRPRAVLSVGARRLIEAARGQGVGADA